MLDFYLAQKLNSSKHYLRTSFILLSSNLLIDEWKYSENMIEQLHTLYCTSRRGEVKLHAVFELFHILTSEVCKSHDFFLQSHTAVSLSIPRGFAWPFEALQTFFVHGTINSYLRTISEISAHLQHRELKISYLLLRTDFFRTTCWVPVNLIIPIKTIIGVHPFTNVSDNNKEYQELTGRFAVRHAFQLSTQTAKVLFEKHLWKYFCKRSIKLKQRADL